MEFCDKCGGLLEPQKKAKKTYMVCRKCGKKKLSAKRGDFKLTTSNVKKKEKIIIVEKKQQFEALPTTKARCPKCGNDVAFWWMQQTRAADEPPTRFFRCTKCEHTWREYE